MILICSTEATLTFQWHGSVCCAGEGISALPQILMTVQFSHICLAGTLRRCIITEQRISTFISVLNSSPKLGISFLYPRLLCLYIFSWQAVLIWGGGGGGSGGVS